MNKYYRYIVAVAGFIVTLCGGTLYAWGVFVPTLEEFFEVTRAEIMVPFAVASITFALGMVPAGRLQDKKGPKLTVTLGGILTGLGYILSSTADHVGHLIIFFGLVSGAGLALSYNGSVASGVKWFPDLKGTATGIIVGGFGLGALAFGPLAHTLMERVGWRTAFLILGFSFSLLMIAMALLIIKNPPAGWKPEGWDPAKLTRGRTVEYTGRDFEPGAAIRTPEFIGMWLHFALIISGGFAILTHIRPFSIDYLGFTGGAATGLIALFSLLNFSGRLVLGPLSDRIGRINTFSIIGTLMGIAVSIFILIYYVDIPSLAYPIVLIGGMAFGGYLALSPAFVADVFGLKNIGVNYGAMFTAWGVAGIYGPYFAGRIYDVYGSYEIAFIVFIIQCVVGVLLARSYVRPRLRLRIQKIRGLK
jgi:OFA family oxalate/formate antiporter-like MFS transporter